MGRSSFVGRLFVGALAGVTATWLMDRVTTAVQKLQHPSDAERERAAWPNGQPSVANLVDLVASRLGMRLDEETKSAAANFTHFALGAGPGAAYAVLRDLVPVIGAGRGSLYGVLVWAVNDEYLNTALGLSGPPAAYPLWTHLRGLIGHVVFGVSTDLAIDLLGVARRRPG